MNINVELRLEKVETFHGTDTYLQIWYEGRKLSDKLLNDWDIKALGVVFTELEAELREQRK